MRQLNYSNSNFGFEFLTIELLWVQIFNHYVHFILRYSLIPIDATCATSGTWQRDYATRWIFVKNVPNQILF